MEQLPQPHSHKCNKKIEVKGYDRYSYVCDKPATHKDGLNLRCSKHSGMGRYVIRHGEIGEIIGRFDAEDEASIRFAGLSITGIQLQRISAGKRRNILSK